MRDDEREGLREALKQAAVALKESGLAFALAGSYAGWARGGPEPNHDVDFVIMPDDADHAKGVLSRAGLRVVQPPEDWLFKAYAGDAMVDILFRQGGSPVDRTLLDRADDVEVLSVRMPVLAATDLLGAKLAAMNEHDCDLGSVLPAARALREQIDWQSVRHQAAGNPFADAALVLFERLEITST